MKASDYGVKASELDQFGWSADEELFRGRFSTREAALAEGREVCPNRTIYVGVVTDVDVNGPDAGDVISDLAESASEQGGDFAEGYLDHVTDEARRDLDAEVEKAVAGWLTRHNLWPTFYRIESVTEHPALGLSELGGEA